MNLSLRRTRPVRSLILIKKYISGLLNSSFSNLNIQSWSWIYFSRRLIFIFYLGPFIFVLARVRTLVCGLVVLVLATIGNLLGYWFHVLAMDAEGNSAQVGLLGCSVGWSSLIV